ncbi:hypothetical protein GGI43DRAFT_295145 [Trichoderma evansii]
MHASRLFLWLCAACIHLRLALLVGHIVPASISSSGIPCTVALALLVRIAFVMCIVVHLARKQIERYMRSIQLQARTSRSSLSTSFSERKYRASPAASRQRRLLPGEQQIVVRILSAQQDIAVESMTCCLERYPGLSVLVYPILPSSDTAIWTPVKCDGLGS